MGIRGLKTFVLDRYNGKQFLKKESTYKVVIDGNHFVRSIYSMLAEMDLLNIMILDVVRDYTRKILARLDSENIYIEHVFFDGGDEYEKAPAYIDRTCKSLKASNELFEHLKRNEYYHSGETYIMMWTRFIITKEICNYVGNDKVSFGGLDTDKLIAKYANDHECYILSEDGDLFLMCHKGIIYYSLWLNDDKKSLITHSYRGLCRKLGISYEALKFACFLVGNDSTPSIMKLRDAIQFVKKMGSQDFTRTFCLSKYVELNQMDRQSAKSLFDCFYDAYNWKTAKEVPSAFFISATDNRNDPMFDVTSSYVVSKAAHLLYSWIYKSPVLVNPFNQEHVADKYDHYTMISMDLVGRKYHDYKNQSDGVGVIMMNVKNIREKQEAKQFAKHRVSILNSNRRILDKEVKKSLQMMDMIRGYSREMKLGILQRVANITSISYIDMVISVCINFFTEEVSLPESFLRKMLTTNSHKERTIDVTSDAFVKAIQLFESISYAFQWVTTLFDIMGLEYDIDLFENLNIYDIYNHVCGGEIEEGEEIEEVF